VAAFCSVIMLMSQAHYGTQNNNWLEAYLTTLNLLDHPDNKIL
jgi:hypothetical protein